MTIKKIRMLWGLCGLCSGPEIGIKFSDFNVLPWQSMLFKCHCSCDSRSNILISSGMVWIGLLFSHPRRVIIMDVTVYMHVIYRIYDIKTLQKSPLEYVSSMLYLSNGIWCMLLIYPHDEGYALSDSAAWWCKHTSKAATFRVSCIQSTFWSAQECVCTRGEGNCDTVMMRIGRNWH